MEHELPWLIFSRTMWEHFRDGGIDVAQWTDEELECHDPVTGLIGRQLGVDCYMQKLWI